MQEKMILWSEVAKFSWKAKFYLAGSSVVKCRKHIFERFLSSAREVVANLLIKNLPKLTIFFKYSTEANETLS